MLRVVIFFANFLVVSVFEHEVLRRIFWAVTERGGQRTLHNKQLYGDRSEHIGVEH